MTMHAKILASTLATALAIPTAMLMAPAQADAGQKVTAATCRIHAVEASEEGDGALPKELSFLSDQLAAPEFTRYKSFRLLDAKDFKLGVDKVVEQKFKSGHTVKLSLVGGEDDKIELNTDLLRGGASIMSMLFSMKSNQSVLIPVRREDSAVIFAYQCKAG